MIHRRKNAGFTLIELMLAMAFVGALLVAIAVTTIHIMGTYTKGLTIREVNQAGRTISEDIQRTIAGSAPFRVVADGGNSPSYINPDGGGGGRLCTGDYTYAWNYGNTEQLGGTTSTPAYNVYSGSNDVLRFVKVSDVGGALCSNASQPIEKSQSRELLLDAATEDGDNSAGDKNLAVQAFSITEGARDEVSEQAIYAITFVLGTNNRDGFTLLNASNSACLPPGAARDSAEGASDNQSFCAINKFNIIVRAGNRSGSL